MEDFTQKVVVITGGASGVGRSLALAAIYDATSHDSCKALAATAFDHFGGA